jgi:hypothetical protein
MCDPGKGLAGGIRFYGVWGGARRGGVLVLTNPWRNVAIAAGLFRKKFTISCPSFLTLLHHFTSAIQRLATEGAAAASRVTSHFGGWHATFFFTFCLLKNNFFILGCCKRNLCKRQVGSRFFLP